MDRAQMNLGKLWLIFGAGCIAVSLCIGMLWAASAYGGFGMFLVFLVEIWLIGIGAGFTLGKETRQFCFEMVSAMVVILLNGACTLKNCKQSLRTSISAAYSAVQLNFGYSQAEQSAAQQSADKNAHFLEYLLDHY